MFLRYTNRGKLTNRWELIWLILGQGMDGHKGEKGDCRIEDNLVGETHVQYGVSEQTLTVPVIRCVLAHLWLFWLRRCSGSDDFAARPTGPTRGSRVPWIYGEYLSSLFMQVETVQVRFVVRICSRHTHSLTRVFQGLHGVPGPKVRLHDYSMW